MEAQISKQSEAMSTSNRFLENFARLLIKLLDKLVECWCCVFKCRKKAKIIKVSYYRIHIIAVRLNNYIVLFYNKKTFSFSGKLGGEKTPSLGTFCKVGIIRSRCKAHSTVSFARPESLSTSLTFHVFF